MIDEVIIINKLEQIKINSEKVMGKNKYITQEKLCCLLDKLIDYIREQTEII